MKYFSTFAGIGGFEIGIQNAWRSYVQTIGRGKEIAKGINDDREGLHAFSVETTVHQDRQYNEHVDRSLNERQPNCVGYSEIDKYASSVYEHNFKGVRNYGDITKINADDLPDFDCLVGGFPCQAFSIAGKRRGFEDTRGTLFFDLARILKAKQPPYFVFENVKGLLSHKRGGTFRTIIATIDELGYDCQWNVLNSKNFGVPQNRERVIIVGHLRGTPRPEVFPITGTDSEDIEQRDDSKIIGTINRGSFKETNGVALTIPASYYKGHDNHGARPMVAANIHRGQVPVLLEPTIRRLTPRECERLQAFPDDWTRYGVENHTSGEHKVIEMSDTQRYKMCGNAVTTNVIQAVFERLFLSIG